MAMPSHLAAPFLHRSLAADAIAGVDMRDETGFVRCSVEARRRARQWQGLRRRRGKTERQHAGRRHRGKSRHCFLLRHRWFVMLSARMAEDGLRWRAAPQALMQINGSGAPSRAVPRDDADRAARVHGRCDLRHIEFHGSRLMWRQSIRS
jgi:hypothetical protein